MLTHDQLYVPLVGELPLSIDDSERDVLVRRTGTEVQEHSLIISWFLNDFIRRCFRFVDEVWIEDVELNL